MQPYQYLTLSDVARIAKISRQRMHVLLSELRGPPIAARTPNKTLFDAHVVAQWLDIRNRTKQVKQPVVLEFTPKLVTKLKRNATWYAKSLAPCGTQEQPKLEDLVTRTPMTMKKYRARLMQH